MTKPDTTTDLALPGGASMPARIDEWRLLTTTVEKLRELASRAPTIAAQMLALANELEEQAGHLERTLIRGRVIRPLVK